MEDGRIDGGWEDGWRMGGLMVDGRIDGGWEDGWMDGWMVDRRMGGLWVDGWITDIADLNRFNLSFSSCTVEL